MRFFPSILSAAGVMVLASIAVAADPMISPLPAPMDRIASDDDSDASSIMSTQRRPANATPPVATTDSSLPWKNAEPAPLTPAPAAIGAYQPKIPFGRAEALAPIIPDGPHATVSVPVVDVQSLDAPEAAPATPTAPEADPAKQDPAEPTELTSPIFGESDTTSGPRKIILRLLNKVTAQSSVLTFKPNETVTVGQLEITAISCQISAPMSQKDYAGLIDIVEHSQTNKTVKPLFRGWMYASSPSITALEHPVYDVTMVTCDTPQPAAKKDEKIDEKPAKKGKK